MNFKNNDSNTLQTFWVVLGSFAKFGFAIVSSVILSRYLDKFDYGTYRQVIYVYNTLLVVFTLGLPMAFGYFLPRQTIEQGRDLVNKLTNMFFILGGALSLILFFSAPLIASILKNDDLALSIKIFSIVPLLMLPTMGLEGIYATYRKTYVSAIYLVTTQIFILVCVALPVCLFNGTHITAIIGFVVSSFLTAILALYLKNRPYKNLKRIKTSIEYKEIFKYSLPLMHASIWGIIIASSDQFFVSRYFGAEVFAEFSNGSMELPFVGMIVGACSTVLAPLFSKIIHVSSNAKEEILPIWNSVFRKTAMLIYPILVFCWFLSTPIMSLLYGETYISSSVYFKIKTIVNLFTLIAYGPLVLSLGKVKYYANVHMYGAIILIALEYLSIKLFPDVRLVIVISVLCQIGRIFAMLSLISSYFKISIVKLFPLKLIGLIIIPSSIFFCIYINYIYIENKLLYITTAFISYVIFFGAWSFITKIDYISLIKPILKRNETKITK